jgi:16S rRNA (cytosine967-C5)-methyltransferase
MSRPTPGVEVRRQAIAALVRIAEHGAYANLVLPQLLARSGLDGRDRALVTDLVYGTLRMQRACDHLVDRFVMRDVDPEVRAALRVGAYQLAFAGVPTHAAVSATVGAVAGRPRGFVNAILRRVADAPVEFPDDATRLSYPDWILDRLTADVGSQAAIEALEVMNTRPEVATRPDGYIQDRASQWVAELVEAQAEERIADLCAAPGGKATAMAHTGAQIVAADLQPARARLVVGNAERTGVQLDVLVADAERPPFPPATFDRVLVDAPCSGLGVLRRRPDARWRLEPDAVDRLAGLQRRIVDATVPLVRPGGTFVYSVCTLTAAETLGIDHHLATRHPDLEPLDVPGDPWIAHGRGALLLPQAADTDGMMILRLRRRP